MAGIALTAALGYELRIGMAALPMIVAPIGASAVLVFAVPASPLAQPWSVLGGNVLSALVGVMVSHLIGVPAIAAGVAVGAAILVMSLCRCLHPPGGAAALTAVIGGPVIASLGYAFPFTVVAANSIALLAAGWVFHRLSGHAYPHRPGQIAGTPAPVVADGLHREDIDFALAEMHEAFDIAIEDLDLLLATAERHAARRRSV